MMNRHIAAIVVASVLLACALPALGATIADEVTAAQGLIKADNLADAETHLQAALSIGNTTGLDKLPAADLLLLAEAHRLLMALSYDRAIRTGTLTGDALKHAKEERRKVLGIKNMKIIGHGEKIDLPASLVPGKTNIVDFFSIYCGPCMSFAPYLEALADSNPDLYLVKVDINHPDHKGIDWQSDTVRQFGLQSIPHIKIYGPDGKLVAEGDEARNQVIKMVQDAGLG
jgi:thiol-disulfide isomerase/thioredoxin